MAHVNAILVTAGRQARSYLIAYIADDDDAARYVAYRQAQYDKIKAARTVTTLPIEIDTLKALW